MPDTARFSRGGSLGPVVEDHSALALVAMLDDEALATVVHGVVVTAFESFGRFDIHQPGEHRVLGALPDMIESFDWPHAMLVARMTTTDFTRWIWSGCGRSGAGGIHKRAQTPVSESNLSLSQLSPKYHRRREQAASKPASAATIPAFNMFQSV